MRKIKEFFAMPIGACFDTQGVLIHGLCLFGVSSRNGGDAGDIAALPQLRIIWNAHPFKAYLASDMEWYFASLVPIQEIRQRYSA